MKKILIPVFMLPFAVFAQEKTYSIKGTVSGFADGTSVSFFNRNTNEIDSVAAIKNNTFQINGEHLKEPDFRFLVFDKQQPVIPILLQNDEVKVSGSKDDLANLQISGSAVYDDYKALSQAFAPVNEIFQEQNFTPENVQQIVDICESFIKAHSDSYVSLLAVSQAFQLSRNADKAGKLLSRIDKSLMNTELAGYLTTQINIEKTSSIGAQIMPFTQNDMAGKPVSIADFKGKYVLIDFWASWCRPCRIENPNVVKNYERFKDKNFTVLGVSLDQSMDAWKNAVKMDNLTWTHVSDLKGWQNEVSSKFNVTSIPTNILIDPNGVIIAKNVRGAELGATLERLLGK